MNPEPQQDSPINLLVLLIKHHIRKCKFPNGLPSISEVSSKSLLVMLSVPSQRSRAGGGEAYWVWSGVTDIINRKRGTIAVLGGWHSTPSPKILSQLSVSCPGWIVPLPLRWLVGMCEAAGQAVS